MDADYRALNLMPGASLKDVRKSYKRLALKWHPDHNSHAPETATRLMAQINAAYAAISASFDAPFAPESHTYQHQSHTEQQHSRTDQQHTAQEASLLHTQMKNAQAARMCQAERTHIQMSHGHTEKNMQFVCTLKQVIVDLMGDRPTAVLMQVLRGVDQVHVRKVAELWCGYRHVQVHGAQHLAALFSTDYFLGVILTGAFRATDEKEGVRQHLRDRQAEIASNRPNGRKAQLEAAAEYQLISRALAILPL